MFNDKVFDIIHSCGVKDCGAAEFDSSLLLPHSRKLSLVPENCRSVIVCIFPYFTGDCDDRNVSLYAVSRDYHIILRKYLNDICGKLSAAFDGRVFVPFADSSPVSEVLAASKAGLGVIGFNRTLITPEHGSYVFIGEILTDLPMEYTEVTVTGCEMCGKCLAACPSGALSEKGIDVLRCISDISQKKGELTGDELELFSRGKLIWGCDACQEACPHNKNIPLTYIPEFYIGRRPVVTDENLADGFEERAYAWRGEKVIRRNLKLKRN